MKKLFTLFVFLGINALMYGHVFLSEGFEGGSLPTGWSNTHVHGSHDWEYQDGDWGNLSAHTGNWNACFYEDSFNDDATKLITPEIDLSEALTATLEFWHAQNYFDGQDTMAVYYRTSSSDTWHYLGGWKNSISAWTKETFSLPNLSATYQIAFHGYEEAGYGVVIDDIEVSGTIPCPDPSNQFIGNRRLNSAMLIWTDNVSGGASNFDIELGTTNFAPTGTPTQSGVSNNYTYTGLTANTGYDWYVRANCSNGHHSFWVGANNFTTADGKATNPNPANGATDVSASSTTLDWDDITGADGYHISVGTTSGGTDVVNNVAISGASNSSYTVSSNWSYSTTYYWTVTTNYNGSATVTGDEWSFTTQTAPHPFPLTEDFESGFTYFDNASGNNIDFADDTSLYHGGSHSVHDGYSIYNTNILHETSTIDLSSTTNAFLEFWHIAITEDNYDKCYIQISTDGGTNYADLPATAYQGSSTDYTSGHTFFDEGSYSDWGNITPDNTKWKKETFDLSAYNVANVRIRFKLTSDQSINHNGWYIDDIHIFEPPCPTPGGQTESNITTSAADLGWTSNNATQWDIELGVAGFTPSGNPTQTGVTSNPYTYTGLTENTSYDWYVRSNCGGDGYSDWSGKNSFTTTCASTNTPYFQAFDDVTAPAFPHCMKVEDANNDSKQWETYTATHNSSPNSAIMRYDNNHAMNDWFFTKGLNLTGGVTYEVDFVYKAEQAARPEKLAVKYGTSASSAAMSGTTIFDNNNITNTSWMAGSGTFTPSSTGTYYVGFHGYSDQEKFYLFVDDIQVVEQKTVATWNGTSDNDWKKTTNWSTSMPPGSSTNVTIPPGKTNYPTLTTTGYVNDITIQSTASGDGSFIGAENLMISGTSVVQRHIAAWGDDATHGWHNIASPIHSQNISPGFVDITATPISNNVDLYRWSEPDNMWINIKNSSGNYNQGTAGTNFSNDANPIFEPGYGYLIAYGNEQVKSFTGTFTTENIYLEGLTYSTASGWHLLGNPYQSALYWNKTSWGLTNIDGTAKIWNPSTASYSDLLAGTGIIPAMQGFMVHVNASTGSLTIKASDRTHSTTAWHKDAPVNIIKLTAIDPEGNTAQECIIRFTDDATTGFDTQYDSHFLQGYAPQFYAVGGNNKLSTDALPPNTTEIPLSFIKNASTHFTIKAEGTDNLMPAEKVYLKDLKTGISTLLNEHPEYQFTSSEGDNPQRFMLLFAPVGIRENIVNNKIKVFSVNNRVEIRSKEAISASVNIYNVTGQKIAASVMHNQKSASVKVTNFRGFAVVSIIGNTFISTKKIVIR